MTYSLDRFIQERDISAALYLLDRILKVRDDDNTRRQRLLGIQGHLKRKRTITSPERRAIVSAYREVVG